MQPKISGVILEQSVRFIRARRGVLSLAAGFFLGGGGLSGAALLAWNNQAALPPEEEEKISRRQRKAEAKLAAQEARGTAACSGLIQRWVRFPWWPHWQQVEAEVSHGLLLMRNTAEEKLMSRGSFATGARCVGVPLAGAKVAQVQDAPNAIDVTTAAGERESLRLQTREEHSLWTQALQGEKDRWMARRRVLVEVQVPSSWEAPFEQPRLVSLDRHSAEYRRVEKLAKAQQFKPGPGQSPYVKGRIAVTGVSRVQQPHVWEQYCMRRAIIASENDGECEERELWHGTPVPHIITREGFDPRVCALSGMVRAAPCAAAPAVCSHIAPMPMHEDEDGWP